MNTQVETGDSRTLHKQAFERAKVLDTSPDQGSICPVCCHHKPDSMALCQLCTERQAIDKVFRKDSIRFGSITLSFIGGWVILAAWLHLDLPTSLTLGLLVAITGMIFGLMFCDALDSAPSDDDNLQD